MKEFSEVVLVFLKIFYVWKKRKTIFRTTQKRHFKKGKKTKTHKIERSILKTCLILEDFEHTLTNSLQRAIILCGILSVSFWLYSIFNSIKYSLDQVLQRKYALWVYCWPGYTVIPSITDLLPFCFICLLSTLTTRHKWRYFGSHHFGNLVGIFFFCKCLFQECQYPSKISNWIVFSISTNVVFSIYPELFSKFNLNSGICLFEFLLPTKLT